MRHICLVANFGNSIQFECGTQRCPMRSLVTTDRGMGKSQSAAMTGQHSLWAMQRLRPPVCAALVVVALLGLVSTACGQASKAGGAGHALLFSDHAPVLKNFKNFASDAFTFEAWISTADYCHRGGIMSYALDSKAAQDAKRSADFNHFVVFDPYNTIACHDFEYLDLWPDPSSVSCMAAFNHSNTADYVSRSGEWHHIAVTWTTRGSGRTRIYQDGLLMAETASGKTSPLQSGGALMLGGEQDCYGGCTDSGQAFYGLMDEVRLWRVERSQKDILKWMRASGPGLDPKKELLAYWKFDDPDDGSGVRSHLVALDSSGRGNHLPLVSPPLRQDITIKQGSQTLSTGALAFANSYAFNPEVTGFPTGAFSVELWARTPAHDDSKSETNAFMSVLSYATHTQQGATWLGGVGDSVFTDDAIRIEKYYDEYGGTSQLHFLDVKTAGAVSVHINSNRNGNGRRFENWLDYAVGWTDNAWHHIALTWSEDSGETHFYWDGQEQTPFWAARQGKVEQELPSNGGVAKQLAAGTTRLDHGSLVLGQNQECYGACFSPEQALDGDLAAVRVWSRVLPQSEVRSNMWADTPGDATGLAALYTFKSDAMYNEPGGKTVARDARGTSDNGLELWADAPRFEYSDAPLMVLETGAPLDPPTPGTRGHSLLLSDTQTLILTEFEDWPGDAITVEFWMLSADKCRKGVPFSYATGEYEQGDNSFLILNYNDWGVSVMEDEGQIADHTAGISATDGAWHHIAVTWQSTDGATTLYDNGRKVWGVERGRGKRMPSGGTLIVGREQDCMGGCFDSAAGAAGKLDSTREYGVQDFFGQIDELRIWRTVRSEDQIRQGMTSAAARAGQGSGNGGVSDKDPALVAYWKFDEGQGYLVKDATGRGHDLRLTSQPHWMVVREMAECGNGVVEASEACDDGNTASGDGCSSACQVESGWECTGTSPSECWRAGDPGPHPQPSHQPLHPASGAGESAAGGSSGSGAQKAGHVGVIIASVLFAVMLLACLGVGLLYREALSEAFPAVGDGVSAIRSRLRGRQRSTLYQGLDALDPEERLDIAPEFVGASAPRHPQGPYSPLGGPETRNGHM